MSVQPSQPSGDGQPAGTEGRRFSTLVGAMPVPPAAPAAPAGDQDAAPRPTFTPQAVRPAVIVTPERDDTPDSRDSRDPDGAAAPTRPVSPAVPVVSVVPAPADEDATRALPRPAPADMNEPLLGDAAALRVRWQRVQAGFVDDPREAVGDAADLIEQTAQALVGALRQRQRRLRVMWERGPADDGAAEGEAAADSGEAASGGAATARGADTEHLRLMMQRYRALFNQLCRP